MRKNTALTYSFKETLAKKGKLYMSKSVKLFLLFFLSLCPLTFTLAKQKKDWTFIVYIAADNDLNFFARKNITDMKQIGSNSHINILVQLDAYGIHEKTKRLFIEKNGAIQVNTDDITGYQKLNSGSAQTLIDCCKWAIENYPAEHYALVLWNHGTGILDNVRGKAINASEAFIFNPRNHMLELDRNLEFLDFIESKYPKDPSRGVCFSDTYGSYLTNEKIHYALETVCTSFLDGKKFDIIAFDACLMSMIEVGGLIKDFAHIMVGSQEVELGTGWPYKNILEPFLHKSLSPREFASHIVQSYKTAYENITNDFTQSAVDLDKIKLLEDNVHKVSGILIEALQTQTNYSVGRAVRASRSRRLCTYFSEPTYIDLHHFYSNLLHTVEFMTVKEDKNSIKKRMIEAVNEGLALISVIIFSNEVGPSLTQAKGISIYFPTRYIEASYIRTPFAKKNLWLDLLNLVM